LTGITTKKAKLEMSSVRHRKITQKLAGMIIHEFQPFEDKGFKELMEHLELQYDISHR